ncbi:MAG: hypothetical protein HKN04_08150, partial [Rhodothermaceae bacterium]|nr:hypothetical protein [Rhodothermaceae bacterium]
GHYPVTSDAHIDLLAEDGDPVLFHAEGDGLVAEATFRFAGGPCHVEKLAGPETIVAEAE